MSTNDASINDDAVPTAECRVCNVDVPAGRYCGLCGVAMTPSRGDGPEWLRIKAFGAAPGEHVLWPSLASSLFPQLPRRSRVPFRIGLVTVLLALVALALLRLPAALIAAVALGLPLLFVIYLQEINAFRDLPTRTLVLSIGLGVGLGVGWVLLTGARVAQAYSVPLGTGIAAERLLRDGLAIPIGSALLAMVPVVVVRLLRQTVRESLDGFVIGALGALAFSAAATIARLAPQFAMGLLARHRPMSSLLIEAGIRGVGVPLIAVATGGVIGAALWFRRPSNKAHQRAGFIRIAVVAVAVALLVIYASLGLVDVAGIQQVIQLLLHLGVTLVALLVLRIGLHLALLHEAHDEIRSDEPLLCVYCGHVVPDMAFCPACGVATRASSRSSRESRRRSRPVRHKTLTEGP